MTDQLLAPLAIGALVVAVVALLLALALVVVAARRAGRESDGRGASDAGMDGQLAVERRRVEELRSEVARLDDRLRLTEARAQRSLSRIGIVRFNPFEDTGGNQSFALALLDEESNGLVISSLHSRQQTRLYLKPVSGGAAQAALSDEESEALRQAAEGHRPVA